jgi:hypothetical protein
LGGFQISRYCDNQCREYVRRLRKHSLRSQRCYWIEPQSPNRGDYGSRQCHHYKCCGEQAENARICGPDFVQEALEKPAQSKGREQSGEYARQYDSEALDYDQPQDCVSLSSQGQAYSKFLRSLGDSVGHQAVKVVQLTGPRLRPSLEN